MSTKNIKYTTRESYLHKSEEMLMLLSDQYFNKKRFLLGEGADKDKVTFYLQMNNSLCTKNCELINFIQDKIEGRLLKCGVNIGELTDFSSYVKASEDHLNTKCCNGDDIISECCGWEEVEW